SSLNVAGTSAPARFSNWATAGKSIRPITISRRDRLLLIDNETPAVDLTSAIKSSAANRSSADFGSARVTCVFRSTENDPSPLMICFGAGMICTPAVLACAVTHQATAAQTTANGKLALRVRVVLIILDAVMIPISFYLSG